MFPLIGNGDMYIELRNFNIKILGELLIDSNDFARITNLRLDAKFESTDLYLENLLVIERGLGESINNIIPKVSWDFKVEFKIFIYNLKQFHGCQINITVQKSHSKQVIKLAPHLRILKLPSNQI